MKNIYRIAIFTVAVSVAALLPMRIVWSSDENASVAQVYLEFDPATGQFVSVPVTDANNVDPEAIVKRHDNSAAQTSQTATQDTTTVQQTASTAQTSVVDTGGAASGGVSPMLIVSIVAVGLFGGIVLMMRKKTA